MELKVQTDGGVSFILPTFLKPRYSPADGGCSRDMEKIEGQNVMFVSKQYAYEVKAHVVGAHRIAQITSHSELLSVDISEDALSAERADSDPLVALVSKQRFDGSWLLEDVAELCGVACAVLGEWNPAKTEAAWATALALALLEKRHAEARDKWSLLATKARAFLSGCQ
ncbi:uncharacterized protein LOC134788487 [Penaeus indicus]|uniref:uncharacterized protein LOC134788487 n=1 Tax=Penaeus indicus TaxID=29960 RepID=UPI00300C6007